MDERDYKKRLKQEQLVNPIYLAKLFHNAYEKASKEVGWKTQEECQVEFHDLPIANQKAMSLTCGEIMNHFYLIRKET